MSTPFRSRLSAFFDPPVQGDHAPRRIFWVALAVRLLYVTLAHTYRVKPLEDHFAFGFEAGRIARALVTGFGYADPFANVFVAHTGPTAWLPPLYPLLMAAVFKVFGVYTAGSGWVLLAINCVLSAWTASLVWELGSRFDGLRNARWAGWLWALYPAAMQYAVRWFWEMTLTTALFTFVLVLAMRMRAEPSRNSPGRWCWFGLAWGAIALSNSTLLAFLPVCGIWILLTPHSKDCHPERNEVESKDLHLSLRVAGPILAATVFLACLAPWVVRNQQAFHTFIPLRGNFGAELYLGNGPNADGFLMEYNHPFQSAPQLRLYRGMGEVAYVKMRGEAAKRTIVADPGLFVRNTLKRVYFFWISVPHAQQPHEAGETVRVLDFAFISLAGLGGLALALRTHKPAAGLFAWAILLLPLPYYIVTVHARFRHPLEPVLCVLGVYLFQQARPRDRKAQPA